RLAILDRGRLAAEGAPRELMRQVVGAVVEVVVENSLPARRLLEEMPEVLSITQLGARLRVLIDGAPGLDPEASVRTRLSAAGISAQVEHVAASLEDVFVAATRRPRPADAVAAE